MHVDTLKIQLGYSQFVLGKNLEDLDHAASLAAPTGGGNCINWVLGHLLAARDSFLKTLGCEAVFGEEAGARYQRGADAIGPDETVVSIEQLRTALTATHAAMVAGLDSIDPDRLAEPVPNSPVNNPDETVGSLLAGLVFHEIYHAGQIGALRRATGHDAIM